MARYRVLSWRDIPAQVKVFEEGRRPLSATLSERWQQEIDRVAMRDGLVGTDDYLSQWEWSPDAERDGSAEDVLEALVVELEASWETRRREI
jgi:Virulence factor